MSFPIPYEHLDHERFIRYLQSLGFHATRSDDRLSIWYHDDYPKALAVLVPHRRLADYEELMCHALVRLAAATGVPEEVHYTRAVTKKQAGEFRAGIRKALAPPR